MQLRKSVCCILVKYPLHDIVIELLHGCIRFDICAVGVSCGERKVQLLFVIRDILAKHILMRCKESA